MKHTKLVFAFILFFSITLISCKPDVKKTIVSKDKVYSIVPETTKIGWTAYKTTEKVAVKGTFTKVDVEVKSASSAKEALNGLKFSIPVSSIFSENEDRDTKLKKFFFGVMDATDFLTGQLFLDSDTEGKVAIKMNGIEKSLPITYNISGQLVTFSGVLDLEDWNTQNAINSLNKICFELHKGSDGVSKTWNEVNIDVSTYIKAE